MAIDVIGGYDLLGSTGEKGDKVGYIDTTLPLANAVRTLFRTNAVKASRAGLLYKGLILNINSSHVSAANGLIVQESWDDGVTWHPSTAYTTTVQATPTKIYAKVSAPEIWVQYTNGPSNTTTFDWCILGDRKERGNG